MLLIGSEGGARDMPYNQINGVPLEGDKEQSDRLRSTLSATRLGLDLKVHGDQDVKGKLEVDFLGGANLDNLRIRHAYLNYGNSFIHRTSFKLSSKLYARNHSCFGVCWWCGETYTTSTLYNKV